MPISPYVAKMRSLVGNEVLLLPAVTVLARDGDGRVLLVKHSYTGRWGLVGGSVELDEAPEDSARREALEETGLAVSLVGILAVLGGADFRVTYPNGHEAAFVQIVYEAAVNGGTAHPDREETSEVAWVAVGDLPITDLHPFARATFHALGWL
jgi:ADP-ribose pyrophosphatase YjhB (NUDIX family)